MTQLHVDKVGKAFRTYKSDWHRIVNWFLFLKPLKEQWVLRNISFSMCAGEAIGIVGQNGAGKSTLLKIITGTLRPTEGTVHMSGRVAAILELGMGFNPDKTGRENAHYSAGLMGYSHERIKKFMPDIEEFAELGEYFDQPVRTYSSGMSMRVAFAVATAVRPDILIIDEALSVGDSYFQHKSTQRIQEYREQGTSLLVVSHDRGAIQHLCDRAILLEHGKILKDGSPQEVMDFYNALIAEKEEKTIKTSKSSDNRTQTVSGTGEAEVETIKIIDRYGKEIETVNVGDQVTLLIRVIVKAKLPALVLGYLIKDRLGRDVYGTNTWHTEQIITNVEKNKKIEFRINFPMNLGPGSYSISTALVSTDTHLVNNYEWRDLALVFDVVNLDKTKFVGCLWNEPEIEIQSV